MLLNYFTFKCGAIEAPPLLEDDVALISSKLEIFTIQVYPRLITPHLFHRIEVFVNSPVKSISHFGPVGSAEQGPSIAFIG